MNEINNKTIRVALYCRVSTIDQVNNWTSLDTQEYELRKIIEANKSSNWYLDESMIFKDEWVSGAKEDRPWLDRLKREVELWNVDVVCIWKIDRLFRETQFLLSFVKFLEANWVELFSKQDNIDTKTSQGKFFLTMLGAFASMERDLIKERTILWKISKAREWYYVWGNMPPTWFTLDKQNKMIVDEDESKIIKEIFNLSIEWKSNEDISRIISSKWYKTKFEKMKKESSSRTKKVANYWDSRTIWKILRNECYIGFYYYGRTTKEMDKITKKMKVVENPKEEWIKIPCPRIIEDDIFEQVQKNIDRNKSKGKWWLRIFTWKIVCWLCSAKYNWYKATKGTMNYRCNNSMKSKAMDEAHLCGNTWVSELKIRDLAIKKIYELVNNPQKFYEDFINNNKEFQKIYDSYEEEIKDIDKNLSILRNKNKNLFEELSSFDDREAREELKNIINVNTWKIKTLDTRKDEINSKLDDLKKQKYSINAIQDFIKTYKINLSSLSEEDENKLIDLFVEKVTIKFEDIIIEMNIRWNIENSILYEELKQKMIDLDNSDLKKKLNKNSGGEKWVNNCNNNNHYQK